MRALVVEDDPTSAKLIEAALNSEGIICEPVETGQDAIDLAKHYDYDIIVLDLRLPDMEGFDVIRRLRAAKIYTPALMLSGLRDIGDKVRGLTAGADDYLTKPFHRTELIARVHAIVRRSKGHSEPIIRTGKLAVDLHTRSVEVEGRRLHVTGKEYSILELLSLRKGTTLTKETFLDHLYGGIDAPELKIVDVFICKLRKKIAAATGGEHYIETAWDRGYVLKDPEDDIKINQDAIALRRQRWSSFHQRSLEVALGEAIVVIQNHLSVYSNEMYRSVFSPTSVEDLRHTLEALELISGRLLGWHRTPISLG